MRKILIVVVTLLLLSCAQEEEAPTVDYKFKAYLPLTRHLDPYHQSDKKCLKRAKVDCTAAYAWEYGHDPSYGCPGVEYIVYFNGLDRLDRWMEGDDTPGEIYMLFNEPDLGHWNFPDADTLVEIAHGALERWPNSRPVGPCVGRDTDWLIDFYQRYYHAYGEKFPAHALCGHCYNSAENCIDWTLELIALADELGVPVWLTEFNMPAGELFSARDIVRHNGCFIRFLEEHPSVERYCIWGGGIEGMAGYTIPHDPVTGWQTTYYQYQEEDGSKSWRPSYIGRGYAQEPPTWDECIEWGLIRPDQITEGE